MLVKPNWKSLTRTVIFAGLFFAVLICGNFILKSLYVSGPFSNQLSGVKGISAIAFNKDKIEVTMNRVENIKTVYQEIQKTVGNKNYIITLKDHPNNNLNNIAEKSEIVVFEALQCGNYTEMESSIGELAQKNDAIARVLMDRERIYLQLEQGDYFLYRVFERNNDGIDLGKS